MLNSVIILVSRTQYPNPNIGVKQRGEKLQKTRGSRRLYLTFPAFSAILFTTEEYIKSYGGRDEKGTGEDIRSERY